MAVDTRVLLLISGKRKSGKDFLSNLLMERLSIRWKTVVVGLSHSLKEEYASINGQCWNYCENVIVNTYSVIIERLTGLNYSELITSGDYKERYRREMIEWGEEIRKTDPAYFVRCEHDCMQTHILSIFGLSYISFISTNLLQKGPLLCIRCWCCDS